MNINEIYINFIIDPLEKEIKKLKKNHSNIEIINNLEKLLFEYYEKLYILTNKDN